MSLSTSSSGNCCLSDLLEDEAIHTDGGVTYTLLHYLGHGAFAEVLLAEEANTGQRVAVKRLPRGERGTRGAELPLRVAREVSALQLVQHPNVVRLHGVVPKGPRLYLCLELCCTDLGTLLAAQDRQLPLGVVCSIMRQLLSGLAACHAAGVMHRDVKPANILLTAAGAVKLADFGHAKQFGVVVPEPGHDCSGAVTQHHDTPTEPPPGMHAAAAHPSCPPGSSSSSSSSLQQGEQDGSCRGGGTSGGSTQEPGAAVVPRALSPLPQRGDLRQQQQEQEQPRSSIPGTRWYRAPELLYGAQDYGPEVDVWAAGMVLAELLGLSPLVAADGDVSQLALMQQRLGSISLEAWPEAVHLPDWGKVLFAPLPRRPLAQLLPNAPPAVLELLGGMLTYRPGARVTAAAALHHPCLSGAGGAAGAAGAGAATTGSRDAQLGSMVAAAVAWRQRQRDEAACGLWCSGSPASQPGSLAG